MELRAVECVHKLHRSHRPSLGDGRWLGGVKKVQDLGLAVFHLSRFSAPVKCQRSLTFDA